MITMIFKFYKIMEKIIELLINIIAGAASGDPASYIAFFCLAVIAFLTVAGLIKITGLPKLLMKAWEAVGEDDAHDPEEGE